MTADVDVDVVGMEEFSGGIFFPPSVCARLLIEWSTVSVEEVA